MISGHTSYIEYVRQILAQLGPSPLCTCTSPRPHAPTPKKVKYTPELFIFHSHINTLTYIINRTYIANTVDSWKEISRHGFLNESITIRFEVKMPSQSNRLHRSI